MLSASLLVRIIASPDGFDKMHSTAGLHKPTGDMRLDTAFIVQFGVARQLSQAVIGGPLFRRRKQLPADAATAHPWIDIPAFQVGDRSRSGPVHMVAANGYLCKAAQRSIFTLRDQHDSNTVGFGKLLKLQLMPLRATIWPERQSHPNPLRQVPSC